MYKLILVLFFSSFLTFNSYIALAKIVNGDHGKREKSVSLSGSYLAGRQAGRMRDTKLAATFYSQALKLDNDNQQILERLFLLELSSGNYDRAVKLATRVIKNDTNNSVARMMLGLKSIKEKRYKSAKKHFDVLSKGTIGKVTAAMLNAWTYAAAGNAKKVSSAFNPIAKDKGLSIYQKFHMALIMDLLGKKKIAGKLYEDAYREDNQLLRVIQAYGNFLTREGNISKAKSIYKEYNKKGEHAIIIEALQDIENGNTKNIKPFINNALQGVSEAMFSVAGALGSTSVDAALVYNRLALYMNPENDIAIVLLGEIYQETKRYDEAIASYKMLNEESPMIDGVKISIATSYDAMDQLDKAKQTIEPFLAKKSRNLYKMAMTMGNILRGREQYLDSIKYYDEAIASIYNPEKKHWIAYYFRGISYERSKQWPKAEKDLKKALELEPGQPLVMNYLGYSWVEKNMHLKKAMDLIHAAVRKRPNDGYIIDSLGWAFYQQKEYVSALKFLEKAVSLRPEDPVINDHLGDVYWQVGRRVEARFQWRHAIDLKPEPDVIEKIKYKLKNGLKQE